MQDMELIELLKAIRHGKSNMMPNNDALKDVLELEKDTVAALHWLVKEELERQSLTDANRDREE